MVFIRERLKRLPHRIFQSCGYDFLRYTPENFVALRRMKVFETQKITLVLDVGADEGTYPQALRRSGYRGRVISFEPLSDSFRSLVKHAAKDPLWSCENVAVGNRDQTIEMNVSGHTTSSSILPISTIHLMAMPSSATLRTAKVNMVRLDSLLGRLFGADESIYLKVDVQGFERYVLEGAENVMRQTRAIELELSLATMYEGGATLVEMLDYLCHMGFVMVSLCPVFSDPQTGRLFQVDGIFIKQ